MNPLSNVTDFKLAGLPVGAVAVGLAVGGVGDAVGNTVSTAVPAVPGWAVKAGLAWATYTWAPKFIGKDAANMGALFLTADALMGVIPIRSTVAAFTAGILAKLPLPRLGTAPAPAPVNNYRPSAF